MKMIEIYWDGENAFAHYTHEFITSHEVVKLDALVDAKFLLEESYKHLMQEKKAGKDEK